MNFPISDMMNAKYRKESPMDTKKIRGLLGISRAEFSRRYGIPARTLENWDNGLRVPPDWLLALLERVVRIDAEREQD